MSKELAEKLDARILKIVREEIPQNSSQVRIQCVDVRVIEEIERALEQEEIRERTVASR